jgi:hypothetical protein
MLGLPQEGDEQEMTTKKLIKEFMAFGVSRNQARELIRAARHYGVSNSDAYYEFCAVCVERMLGVFGGDRA